MYISKEIENKTPDRLACYDSNIEWGSTTEVFDLYINLFSTDQNFDDRFFNSISTCYSEKHQLTWSQMR